MIDQAISHTIMPVFFLYNIVRNSVFGVGGEKQSEGLRRGKKELWDNSVIIWGQGGMEVEEGIEG